MPKVLLSLVFIALATPALATDGVLEINQTCAMTTGCFAGDVAGLPVTVATPGSYRLTSDLAVATANDTAITVSADSTSLDLNGFALRGPNSCTGSFGDQLVCDEPGSGVGISAASARQVRIFNGAVHGFGARGIIIDEGSRIEKVNVYSNAGDGILTVGFSCIVRESIIERNGGDGINSAAVTGVYDNTVSINGAKGIDAASGSVVARNIVFRNNTEGIRGNNGSVIEQNSVFQNRNIGIVASSGSIVRGNSLTGNVGIGISLLLGSGYSENVMQDNGTDVSGGVNAGQNVCSGVICP